MARASTQEAFAWQMEQVEIEAVEEESAQVSQVVASQGYSSFLEAFVLPVPAWIELDFLSLAKPCALARHKVGFQYSQSVHETLFHERHPSQAKVRYNAAMHFGVVPKGKVWPANLPQHPLY